MDHEKVSDSGHKGGSEGSRRDDAPSEVATRPRFSDEIWDQIEALDAKDQQSISAMGPLFEYEEPEPEQESSHSSSRKRAISAIEALFEFEDVLPVLPRDSNVQSSGRGSEDGFDIRQTTEFDRQTLDEELRKAALSPRAETVGGRYEIIENLGEGGMARIFRVRHRGLGKDFALKIIQSEMLSDSHLRQAFTREARVLSLMDHPHIVQVTDFGVDQTHGAYIVMELLKGETLHKRLLREGTLRLSAALDVALQLAEALHYMHEQNVIHCDIKPENVFVCQVPEESRRRQVIKLIDFGLSRREALGAELAPSEVGGTPEFMAPEQIHGLAPQPSMDIYATGMLLYQMVTGQPAFEGSPTEIIAAQLDDPPVTPSRRAPESLPERFDELILKMLKKDPDHRPPSMGQVIFEIRTLMEMMGYREARGGRGRRRRRQDTSVRVQLSEITRAFDECPCPIFRIDQHATVRVANLAFCRFIGSQDSRKVIGESLHTTRLGLIYPMLRSDVREAAATGAPLQRILAFARADEDPVSVMLWLVPHHTDEDPTSFTGIILPMTPSRSARVV